MARYGLSCDPDDLVQSAWIRVTTSFAARMEPLPFFDDDSAAARYGYRTLSNLALDQARSARRRSVPVSVSESAVDDVVDHAVEGPENDAVSAVYFEEMIRRLAVASVPAGNCGGCSPVVVRAVAVRAVQVLAVEARRGAVSRGDDWFDLIVDEAVGRVAGSSGSARIRKRKSRCKGCVRELIETVIAQMEGRDG